MSGSVRSRLSDSFDQIIDQHDEMLQYCLRIAEMDIPAILEMLKRLDSEFRHRDGVERSRMRELIDDNLVIARMALAIHSEVNKRTLQRSADDEVDTRRASMLLH
jgi:hypothetical protein